MHAHHLRMCKDTSFMHTPRSPSIRILVISSPHGSDLSRPRRSSPSSESLPLLGAAAGVFANLLPTGGCQKAFSRSETRRCISSLPAHRALTKSSINCSALHEQSATSPISDTSNHHLCRMTSPVHLISVLRFLFAYAFHASLRHHPSAMISHTEAFASCSAFMPPTRKQYFPSPAYCIPAVLHRALKPDQNWLCDISPTAVAEEASVRSLDPCETTPLGYATASVQGTRSQSRL
jgi:hypothetical protein